MPECDLSCIIGKDDICFSRKYDLTRYTENEIWSFLKNIRKYDIFFRPSEKMAFPEGAAMAHDLSCIIWKAGIFSRKHDIFSLGRKWKRSFSGNTWKHDASYSEEKQETCNIGSKFGLSFNLFGWRYSTMNNLQYSVPSSPHEPYLGECLSANMGNHLSIRGQVVIPKM